MKKIIAIIALSMFGISHADLDLGVYTPIGGAGVDIGPGEVAVGAEVPFVGAEVGVGVPSRVYRRRVVTGEQTCDQIQASIQRLKNNLDEAKFSNKKDYNKLKNELDNLEDLYNKQCS